MSRLISLAGVSLCCLLVAALFAADPPKPETATSKPDSDKLVFHTRRRVEDKTSMKEGGPAVWKIVSGRVEWKPSETAVIAEGASRSATRRANSSHL